MREVTCVNIVQACIVLLPLCLSSLNSPGLQGNLMLNGDFEEGKDLTPTSWSLSFYPKRTGIEKCIHRSKEQAKSGQWSLRIDTKPVLGEETILVFNGTISPEAANFKGQKLILSGWVFVEPGTAVRPISIRLRTFGRDEKGNYTFLGDALQGSVLGEPGKWVQFRFPGIVPNREIKAMDLHCHIQPDLVPTVQFLDDLRLEVFAPPDLEIRLPNDTVWRDELSLPIEVQWRGKENPATFEFRLMSESNKIVKQWDKKGGGRIYGLELSPPYLPEGRYRLLCIALSQTKEKLVTAEVALEIVASPWEGTKVQRKSTSHGAEQRFKQPDAFTVMGSVAPTDLPDFAPSEPEPLSTDIDLTKWHEKGYVVFTRHWLDNFSRMSRPRPGEIGAVRVFASLGEYEPATVLVWALKPLRSVRVSATELFGEKATIPPSSVEVRIVRSIRNLPTFHEKRRQVDILEGQTQVFWLLVYIPQQTPPGFYEGRIVVQPENSEPTQVPLLVRVLPLKLPTSPRGYGFWWGLDARWNGYYSKDRDTVLEQIRKQFILLREYGCNMVSCYLIPKMMRQPDSSIAYDFAQDHWGHNVFSLADFFQIGHETKFFSPKVPLQYPGAEALHSWWVAKFLGVDRNSEEFSKFYREACRAIDKRAKEQGLTLAFACVDEIGNAPERRQEALRFYRVAKEAGVLTSVTDNSMHGGVHLMGQKRFDEIIDMRLYNFVTPEMIEHTRRSGDRLWLYNLGSTGWNAKLDRFVFGFFAERCGAEGVSQWAFQWPSSALSPYEAAAKNERTGWHYVLPAPDGPIPTLALEGVREGIDDARYLHLLPQKQRDSFLAEIKPLSIAIRGYLSERSGKALDVMRWKIAREALKKLR
ncbi:MAG: DUF6067 family protein [Armatimonadota bacterium]|nr:DUF6067 family protein [Armatimonadota bacterium]MDW8026287.1 DUF6067 family protein [Armatimonadota bacterium]